MNKNVKFLSLVVVCGLFVSMIFTQTMFLASITPIISENTDLSEEIVPKASTGGSCFYDMGDGQNNLTINPIGANHTIAFMDNYAGSNNKKTGVLESEMDNNGPLAKTNITLSEGPGSVQNFEIENTPSQTAYQNTYGTMKFRDLSRNATATFRNVTDSSGLNVLKYNDLELYANNSYNTMNINATATAYSGNHLQQFKMACHDNYKNNWTVYFNETLTGKALTVYYNISSWFQIRCEEIAGPLLIAAYFTPNGAGGDEHKLNETGLYWIDSGTYKQVLPWHDPNNCTYTSQFDGKTVYTLVNNTCVIHRTEYGEDQYEIIITMYIYGENIQSIKIASLSYDFRYNIEWNYDNAITIASTSNNFGPIVGVFYTTGQLNGMFFTIMVEDIGFEGKFYHRNYVINWLWLTINIDDFSSSNYVVWALSYLIILYRVTIDMSSYNNLMMIYTVTIRAYFWTWIYDVPQNTEVDPNQLDIKLFDEFVNKQVIFLAFQIMDFLGYNLVDSMGGQTNATVYVKVEGIPVGIAKYDPYNDDRGMYNITLAAAYVLVTTIKTIEISVNAQANAYANTTTNFYIGIDPLAVEKDTTPSGDDDDDDNGDDSGKEETTETAIVGPSMFLIGIVSTVATIFVAKYMLNKRRARVA